MKNENIFKFEENDISSGAKPEVKKGSSSGGRHYAKKKRRKSSVFSRIGRNISSWWRRRKKWQRVTMVTVTSLLLVAAIAFGAFRMIFDYNYNNITKNPEDLGFKNVINEKVFNVALFGIDTRKPGYFKGLSDSIMILSINTETKKVKLISVMRDSLVPITYNGKTTYTKINAAYSKGGPELAIKTLNSIFDLDISEYATVNFFGMSEIIDAVGGIDATLAEGELDVYGYDGGVRVNWGLNGLIAAQCGYMKISPDKYYIKTAGLHHLNGVQAVAYARIRHAANADGTNNDYGRTDRQRYVMEQLFNKALTLQKSQYVKLAKALIPCSETSLSYSEIMGLAFDVLLDSPKFEQTRVPLTEYQMPNSRYVYYDLKYVSKLIHAFIYDDIKPEDYIEANGVEKNDWYANRYNTSGSNGGNKTSSGSSGNKTNSSSGSSANNSTTTSSNKVTSSSVNSNQSSSVISSGDDSLGGTTSDDSSSSAISSGNDSLGETTGNDSSDTTTGDGSSGETTGNNSSNSVISSSNTESSTGSQTNTASSKKSDASSSTVQ